MLHGKAIQDAKVKCFQNYATWKCVKRTEKLIARFRTIEKKVVCMKETMMKLLLELLKDSSRSDRKLAKVLGVSQATVSRMRSKLVSERIIREFTVIPDFVKIGYEIMAISFVKTKMAAEMREKAKEYVNKHPNIIFMTRAQGMGRNGLMISLHRDYAEYSDFLADLLVYWGDDIEERDDILISLKQSPVRPFSLSYLAKLEEKPKG